MHVPISTENGMDRCQTHCIHPEAIEKALTKMPEAAHLLKLADFYKLFGDATRLAIISALGNAELCVCDLCAVLNMKQPAVSHQLRTLRQARIVTARRDGKIIYYTLNDEHVRKVLSLGLAHLCEPHEMMEAFFYASTHDEKIPGTKPGLRGLRRQD
jgi:ArsR family transcriptional regulator